MHHLARASGSKLQDAHEKKILQRIERDLKENRYEIVSSFHWNKKKPICNTLEDYDSFIHLPFCPSFVLRQFESCPLSVADSTDLGRYLRRTPPLARSPRADSLICRKTVLILGLATLESIVGIVATHAPAVDGIAAHLRPFRTVIARSTSVVILRIAVA